MSISIADDSVIVEASVLDGELECLSPETVALANHSVARSKVANVTGPLLTTLSDLPTAIFVSTQQ
jgi:hypothetical protein